MYSFEYFPPRTERGMENLLERIDRMSTINPLWVDITWRAGTTSHLTLEICQHVQMFTGLDVMMHLTCSNMDKSDVDYALEKCREYGVRNILALRGDPPEAGEEAKEWEFNHGIDLIRYIKKHYGDYFCIGAAGYPETHLEAPSTEDDLTYLKEKVDAGADLIITQLFFDNEIFLDYEKRCKEMGITVPVIPGIMPIQGFGGFTKMTTLCQTKVPSHILEDLEPIKNDESKVKKYGIDLCVKMCQDLIEKGVRFLHFYTINLERSVAEVVSKLGIKNKRKRLPWTKPSFEGREDESVRPIFWANKPRSYIARTLEWDEYPNGRWGVSRSPAFGDMKDFPSMSKLYKKGKDKLKELWGEDYTAQKQIGELIISYIEGKTKRLPWCEEKIQEETSVIGDFLKKLNQNYLFTVNTQPRVNSLPSDDSVFGWGPEGGYVYQKQYIEFLIPKELVEDLVAYLDKHPFVSYQGINSKGEQFCNVEKDSVNAVTWGVFPQQEVAQPTVVDHKAFYIWSEELFETISDQWMGIYEKDSTSYNVIKNLYDNYYLVNVVDNDFVKGGLEETFLKFIADHQEKINNFE